MGGLVLLLASASALVGTRFILSHPLRRPVVAATDEKSFTALYSVAAFATLCATVWAYNEAPDTVPLWHAGDGMWALVTALMLVASVMLVGSLMAHMLICPVEKNIIVAMAIAVLSLLGAALQDRKKAELDPVGWSAWAGRTRYWPFVAIAQSRASFGGSGAHALGGGVLVRLLETWANIPLTGWRAGVWRWLQ